MPHAKGPAQLCVLIAGASLHPSKRRINLPDLTASLFGYGKGWAKSKELNPCRGHCPPAVCPTARWFHPRGQPCFSADGHRSIEPSRYLLGAGRRVPWTATPTTRCLFSACLQSSVSKNTFSDVVSRCLLRSWRRDSQGKENQAEIIPASAGESLQRRG